MFMFRTVSIQYDVVGKPFELGVHLETPFFGSLRFEECVALRRTPWSVGVTSGGMKKHPKWSFGRLPFRGPTAVAFWSK